MDFVNYIFVGVVANILNRHSGKLGGRIIMCPLHMLHFGGVWMFSADFWVREVKDAE